MKEDARPIEPRDRQIDVLEEDNVTRGGCVSRENPTRLCNVPDSDR